MLADLRRVLPFFIASRLWVALFVYLGHTTWPYRKYQEGAWIGVDNWWLNPWTTYDSQWYLKIAQHGYDAMTSAFQPLYPLLLRVAGQNEITMAAWGVLLSNLFFWAALAVLFRLTQEDFGDNVSMLAVGILAFYPTTAVFSAVYSESFFGLLIFTTWLCARRGHWATAAVFACLAALTRNAGPVIGFALAFEVWTQCRARKLSSRQKIGAVCAVLFPMFCFAALHFYYKNRFGELAGINAYKYTFRSFGMPWTPLVRDLRDIVSGTSPDMVTILSMLTVCAAFALAWRFRKLQPVGYTVYLLCIMMMHLTYGRYVPPYTNGALRYMSTASPFTQSLARLCEPLLENKFRLRIVVAGYLLVCALFSFLFGQRQFSGG